MAKTLPFYKIEASANDFVVVDNRKHAVTQPKKFTREVCSYHTGVGADGVLLFEKSRKADFKMRILNSDGSEVEACGNGFRCIALYARKHLGYPASFTFESLSGLIEARFSKDQVRVRMAKPFGLKLDGSLTVDGCRISYSFLNTGVPHVVVFDHELGTPLEKIDVARLGRAIREHKQFKPKGTNVNFVKVKNKKEIQVRTYERGVEQETQACGTGSTASAAISGLKGLCASPVKVKTTGGEVLTIYFDHKNGTVTEAFLEGKARIVFEGKLRVS